MTESKPQKIRRSPSIVFSALLLLSFSHLSCSQVHKEPLYVIPIFLADSNLFKKFPDQYQAYRAHFPPIRNYDNITLTGNVQDDQIKLAFAEIRIRDILSENDTTCGVHFRFSSTSQFWSFLAAIEILKLEGAKTYAPTDSDLWFYILPTYPSKKTKIVKDFFYL